MFKWIMHGDLKRNAKYECQTMRKQFNNVKILCWNKERYEDEKQESLMMRKVDSSFLFLVFKKKLDLS